MDLDLGGSATDQRLHEIVCIETENGKQKAIRTWDEGCDEPNEEFIGENGVVVARADIINWEAGDCAIEKPKIDYQQLCDMQADGTIVPFIRRTTTRFDDEGEIAPPVEVADFGLDHVTAYTVTGMVSNCNDENFDTEFTCAVTDANDEPVAVWVRHQDSLSALAALPHVSAAGFAVFNQDGTPFDITQEGFRLVSCTPPKSIHVEVGCISGAATADFNDIERCPLGGAVLNSEQFTFRMEAGWTVEELVEMINTTSGEELLDVIGGALVYTPNVAQGNLVLLCLDEVFREDFGTQTTRTYSEVPMGASTDYNFLDDNGVLGPENSYAVARVSDLRPRVFDMGTAAGLHDGTDSSGDVNGNVLAVNGAVNAGVFYTQDITGLQAGQGYTFRAFVTNGWAGSGAETTTAGNSPDVTLRVINSDTGDVIGSVNTGPITFTNEWREFNFDFVTNTRNVSISLVNNSPVSGGNDLLLDDINFSKISRIAIPLRNLGISQPVEIIKTVNPDGSIDNIRIFSANGDREYDYQTDIIDERHVLSVGDCPSIESALTRTYFTSVEGCMELADGGTETVVIHNQYLERTDQVDQVQATWYTTVTGANRSVNVGETVTVGACATAASKQVSVEVGCLASPATVDMTRADKCNVDEVILNGEVIDVNLDENWTIAEFVDAVNAARPNSLIMVNGSIASAESRSFGNLQIVCQVVAFEETFGEGGSDGNREQVDSTTYNFFNNGQGQDNGYTVTTMGDTGLASWSNRNGTITTDASGDANGNAMIILANANAGLVYTQPTPAEVGHEYRLKFFAADTTIGGAGFIRPNIKFEIVNLDDNSIVNSGDSGDIPWDGEWHEYGFDFVARTENLGFRLLNNSGGGTGNDFAIDQITFAEVLRSDFVFEQRGDQIPVEIIKVINDDASIESLRVWSSDGTTEYTIPDPEGRVLSAGACNVATIPTSQSGADEVDFVNEYDWLALCDTYMENGVEVTQSFLRRYTTDVDGRTEAFTSQLNGTTPYITQGEVGVCGGGGGTVTSSDGEFQILCDTTNTPFGDQSTRFLRRYTIDSEGDVTTTDTMLDGTTGYNTQGTVGVCPEAQSFVTHQACYVTDAEPEPQLGFVRHDDSFVGINGVPNVNPNGFAVFDNEGNGVDIAQAGFEIVNCVSPVEEEVEVPDVYTTTVQDVDNNDTLTITGGADMVSYTIRNRSMTNGGSFRVNGGNALTLDPMETFSSGGVNEDGGTLNDVVEITADFDSVIRVTVVRRV